MIKLKTCPFCFYLLFLVDIASYQTALCYCPNFEWQKVLRIGIYSTMGQNWRVLQALMLFQWLWGRRGGGRMEGNRFIGGIFFSWWTIVNGVLRICNYLRTFFDWSQWNRKILAGHISQIYIQGCIRVHLTQFQANSYSSGHHSGLSPSPVPYDTQPISIPGFPIPGLFRVRPFGNYSISYNNFL